MRILFSIITIIATITVVACHGKNASRQASVAGGNKGAAVHKLEIPQPSPLLTDAAGRLEDVAARFWTNFDFEDKTWIADTATLEQAFADWTGLLMELPTERAAQLTGEWIRKAEGCPELQLRLADVAEFYFYHPNSPFRNEDWYIPVLEGLLASPKLGDDYKVRPAYQLEMARKNRPGMTARDFTYTLADGKTGQLSQIQANYTLLLFYNPDCNDCRRIEQCLQTSETFLDRIKTGHLKVAAIYPDADIRLWREHLPEMPQNWVVGYDDGQKITTEELYSLPAIPTLYLLDKDKKVVLKDAPVERIEKWLQMNDS